MSAMSSEPPRLILASASPRRRELLALFGLPFEVVPSRYEEPLPPAEPISLPEFVAELALRKAEEVATRPTSGYVLGADTMVTLSAQEVGVPLGKPVDTEDARRMLWSLSGKVHTVYTGIALIAASDQGVRAEPLCAVSATRVRFRPLNEEMIAGYLATGEPFDKAGAYGAQGYAAPFIESYEGDFFNVVGLPLCETGRLLEQAGVEWWRHRSLTPPILG